MTTGTSLLVVLARVAQSIIPKPMTKQVIVAARGEFYKGQSHYFISFGARRRDKKQKCPGELFGLHYTTS